MIWNTSITITVRIMYVLTFASWKLQIRPSELFNLDIKSCRGKETYDNEYYGQINLYRYGLL